MKMHQMMKVKMILLTRANNLSRFSGIFLSAAVRLLLFLL